MTDVDQGTRFGTWNDPTSRLMYHDAMPALLSGVRRDGLTLDLGGGNGLATEWFDHLVTVDTDVTKDPTVVADALRYVPPQYPERVLIRYLLHYLTDDEVRQLLRNVARYSEGPVIVIQFVNNDLASKYANSVNETRWFRTETWTRNLVESKPWRITQQIKIDYDVVPAFYANRLGAKHPTGHPETVVSWVLEA
jgi:hypothetical protein